MAVLFFGIDRRNSKSLSSALTSKSFGSMGFTNGINIFFLDPATRAHGFVQEYGYATELKACKKFTTFRAVCSHEFIDRLSGRVLEKNSGTEAVDATGNGGYPECVERWSINEIRPGVCL